MPGPRGSGPLPRRRPSRADEVCRAAARPEPARPRAPPQTTAGAARNKPACGPHDAPRGARGCRHRCLLLLLPAACCLPRGCRHRCLLLLLPAAAAGLPAPWSAVGLGGPGEARGARCCSRVAEEAGQGAAAAAPAWRRGPGRRRVCARTRSPRVTRVWSSVQTSSRAGMRALGRPAPAERGPLQRGLELREQRRSMAWELLRTSKHLEASTALAVRDAHSRPRWRTHARRCRQTRTTAPRHATRPPHEPHPPPLPRPLPPRPRPRCSPRRFCAGPGPGRLVEGGAWPGWGGGGGTARGRGALRRGGEAVGMGPVDGMTRKDSENHARPAQDGFRVCPSQPVARHHGCGGMLPDNCCGAVLE
jgi:hypothetical protein